MSNPLVTIIIPVYNVEEYVAICIESIINQTYKNLEILIVNDGSTDRSGEICDKFAQSDSRIKVYHKSNKGVASARNFALDMMSGDFVSFIDSDDFIHPNTVDIWLEIIQKSNAKIAVAKYKNVYENDDPQSFIRKKLENIQLEVVDNISALDFLFHDRYVETVLICNKLFSSDLFSSQRFTTAFFHIDEHIMYQLIYKAGVVAFCNVELYFYLQRKTSFMNLKINTNRLDVLHASRERIEFFKENHLEHLYVKAVYAYFDQIIYFYQIFKKQGDLDTCKKLRRKFNSEYPAFFVKSKVKFKLKFLLGMFYIQPLLYKKIMDVYTK